MRRRILVKYAAIVGVALSAVSAVGLAGQTKAPIIIGVWPGQVDAGGNRMAITLTVTSGEKDKLGGDISSPHGTFKVTSVASAEGKWTVKFVNDAGESGQMSGAIKADTFAGDWDFHPHAVGTFDLTRQKK